MKVAAVQAGGEDDLRHFLESALLEVNTAFTAADAADDGQPSEQDARMTDAFRGFAR